MQNIFTSHVLNALNIDRESEFAYTINFLLNNGMNADLFIEDNKGLRGVELFTGLYRERYKLLERTRYSCCEEFIESYHRDPRAALERMFGEYIDEAKFRHVRTGAEDIYRLHMKDPNARFMRAAAYM
ncbi:hypothetical protein K0T92_04865 [Paenibacillus oenotherae]|uniref:Uncharacterized protein n=1 Tax=Paenibacillus oenotherae TaxID=1435645 RepID=A0ABS7D297_9BACL|nr:hypothetical protein [Paenibacillus oenotherae]MBW7474064.1 hypothetical protein [Paenibacillus oenotherae]